MNFSSEDLQLFQEILKTQSKTYETDRMRAFIEQKAKSYGAQVETEGGNVYVTKGQASIYPCLVAHTDTVHKIRDDERYRVVEEDGCISAIDPTTNEPVGVGGDDKVGIFIALYFIKHLPVMKAAFFRDEEEGCQGACEARMEFFADAAYALECDRRENADFVRVASGVPLYGDEFSNAVGNILADHGYREVHGLITDVRQLKLNGLPIAAANISCGYYNWHRADEYIVLYDVQRCAHLVGAIFELLGHKQWAHHRDVQLAAD